MSNAISSKIAFPVVFLTIGFALAGMIFPTYLQYIQYPLFTILVLAIGLPHGATDYLLFRRLQGSNPEKTKIIKFFVVYLTAVAGFLAIWMIFPLLALSIFLLISAYHFGQSNWENVSISVYQTFVLYVLWGAFAIGGAVLWHWNESNIIIGQLLGYSPEYPAYFMENIQLCIIFLNVIFIFFLKLTKKISISRLLNEIAKLAILSTVFYFTPMLVGFTLYFTLWHSLSSLINQLNFYKKLWPSFTILDYYKQAAPYTFIAVLGLVIMIFTHRFISPDVSTISTFMIFIASMTLPHIFLVEQSYH